MSLVDFLFTKASVISEFRLIKNVRQGLMYSIPVILTGSAALLILNMPIAGFQNLLNYIFGECWRDWLLLVHRGSFEVLSVTVLLGVSYATVSDNAYIRKDKVPRVLILTVVFGCYILFVSKNGELLPAYESSATGLFGAIFISVMATNIFVFSYHHRIFKKNRIKDYHDSTLTYTLRILEPALVTFLIFALIKMAYDKFALDGYFNFSGIIHFMNHTYGIVTAVLFDVISHAMWFFGIHGNNILEPVSENVLRVSSAMNSASIASGLAPTEILTKQFMDVFVFIGGSGSTLSLVAAILIKGRKNSNFRLASFSLVPGIFNINELLVFGMPIVLNPYFLVPFILTPVVTTVFTYFAMSFHLVPYTINEGLQWTAPILIGGYQATGSVAGSILQLMNLVIGIFIYLPFVELYEKHRINLNKKHFSLLVKEVFENQNLDNDPLVERMDEIGFLSRCLAENIRESLNADSCEMYMEFQPQMSYSNTLMGAEALLRWNHDIYGLVPPPVIVRIAEESNLGDFLGNWVVDYSFSAMEKWEKEGITDFDLSLNITAMQLKNKGFIDFLKSSLEKYNLNPINIILELTETTALDKSQETKDMLIAINEIGFKLAIDDFGMGHSSLMYIKNYKINTLKLDGSLIHDIANDLNSQEIVLSISSLCRTLNLTLIAEFVENTEQKEKLHQLGCDNYQGYLYSKAISSGDFVAYFNGNR